MEEQTQEFSELLKSTKWQKLKDGLAVLGPTVGLLGLGYKLVEAYGMLVVGYPFLGAAIWILLYSSFMVKRKMLLEEIFEYPALVFYLAEKDEIADDEWHNYTSEEWTFKIDGFDSEWTARLQGVNTRGNPSSYIPFKICGHTPMPVGGIDLEVTDNKISRILHPRVEADKKYKKIYNIPFFTSLPTSEDFDVSLKCKWQGHFAPKETYVFMPIYHYKRGLKKYTLVIESDTTITNYWVFKYNKRFRRLIPTPERCVEEDGGKKLTFEKSEPELKAHEIYIILFRRE